MKKKTDIQKIREISTLLYDCVPIKDIGYGICSHPYVGNMAYMDSDGNLKMMNNEQDFKERREQVVKQIEEGDLIRIQILLRNPYKMLWFKLCKDYMSAEDYANYLVHSWISQENPNQDINVSRRECISYFKKAQKDLIMNEDELKHYNELDDVVELYRGVAVGREKFGLSWTDSLQNAEWFQNRFNRGEKVGYLLRARVPKKHILAYLNSRGEKECVVDVYKIKNLIEVIEK